MDQVLHVIRAIDLTEPRAAKVISALHSKTILFCYRAANAARRGVV